jgi:hypothetical protein
MMVRRVRWFVRAFGVVAACLLLPTADITPTSAQTAARLVVAKYWKCVLDHAASYQELPSEPVIIFLSLCPATQPSAEDLARLASNLGDVPEFAKSKISNTLVMSKATFGCVLRHASEIARSAGQDPNMGELILLDVDSCREK